MSCFNFSINPIHQFVVLIVIQASQIFSAERKVFEKSLHNFSRVFVSTRDCKLLRLVAAFLLPSTPPGDKR
jgi:hypothetical protein